MYVWQNSKIVKIWIPAIYKQLIDWILLIAIYKFQRYHGQKLSLNESAECRKYSWKSLILFPWALNADILACTSFFSTFSTTKSGGS